MTDTHSRSTLNQDEKILYTFDKSQTEQVRISETTYLNKQYIDFRVFAKTQSGDYIPTKKGITINKQLASKYLKEAVSKIVWKSKP